MLKVLISTNTIQNYNTYANFFRIVPVQNNHISIENTTWISMILSHFEWKIIMYEWLLVNLDINLYIKCKSGSAEDLGNILVLLW